MEKGGGMAGGFQLQLSHRYQLGISPLPPPFSFLCLLLYLGMLYKVRVHGDSADVTYLFLYSNI
jgi:hypothetical protein